MRGRSRFCSLGLSRGLFSNLGVQNWKLFRFRKLWFVVGGGLSGGGRY